MTATATSIITRGQVWLADLGKPVGSEQGGIRPVLVVSNDKNNILTYRTKYGNIYLYQRTCGNHV